jgi:hypothetical protein
MENRGPIPKGSPKQNLAAVWNPHGFHVLDRLPKGQKWNKGYFISNIGRAIRENFPVAEDDGNRRFVIRVENVRPHLTRLGQRFRDHVFGQKAFHSPYSPDLASSEFWAFGDGNRQLIGQPFETREELVDAVQWTLKDFNPAMLQSAFGDWMMRFRRWIQLKGVILSKV